jgi:hypothetical protein
MIRGPRSLGDPFEGRGAQRTRVRLRIEGVVALTMAVAAFSAALALWVGTLAPVATSLFR